MANKRNIGRDLSRLEDHADDPDAADRVGAYWAALADAIRARENGTGDPGQEDLPDAAEFFPDSYDHDDIVDAFSAADVSWGEAAKRVAQRRDTGK